MSWSYVVLGRGEFPIDMLRRDGANFADIVAESLALNPGSRDSRMIRLASIHQPNTRRWLSFGWHVQGIVQTTGDVTPYMAPAPDPELEHGEYQPKTTAEAW